MSEYYEDYSASDIERWRREQAEAMKAPEAEPNLDLYAEANLSEEDQAGLAKFRKVFGGATIKSAQGPGYVSLNPYKEVSPMSEQLKGVVEAKKVDGNRYGFKVNGKWASCFLNSDTPEEAKALLEKIQPGYSVTFSTYENKGYLNIDGVEEWQEGEPPAKPQSTGTSFGRRPAGGGGGRSNWKPEDKRPGLVTMTFSYAKDHISDILKSPS